MADVCAGIACGACETIRLFTCYRADVVDGERAPCMPIEEAVRDFVTHHLSQPDPSL